MVRIAFDTCSKPKKMAQRKVAPFSSRYAPCANPAFASICPMPDSAESEPLLVNHDLNRRVSRTHIRRVDSVTILPDILQRGQILTHDTKGT